MLSSPIRIPDRGAAVIIPQGISGVVVPAHQFFPGGADPTKRVDFVWQSRWFLYGMIVTTTSGDPADLAALSLSATDEQHQNIFTDGQGVQLQGGCLSLRGVATGIAQVFGGRFWALQRLVQPGDIWSFRWANALPALGGHSITPQLMFLLGVERARVSA